MTRDSSEKHKQNLSELPEEIVNRIFCCMNLTNKGIIQLSLVSKLFRSIVQKNPFLVFDGSDSNPEAQLKYVISTLERYQEHNILLEKFTFKLDTESAICSTSTEYDRCIKLASAQKGLRFLSLSMPKGKGEGYNVPRPVFEADSLVELRLENCRMQMPEIRIAWRNLRRLTLDYVGIGEGVFLNIIKSCHLIEALKIMCCRGDIQLEYIETSTKLGNLKDLLMNFEPNIRTTSNSILSFPRLEKLRISNSCSKTMNISSPSVKRIEYAFWDHKEGPHQVHLDAPNMASFDFSWLSTSHWNGGNGLREIDFPKLSFAGNSSRWTSHLTILTYSPSLVLMQFKEILKKFAAALINRSKIASVTVCLDFDCSLGRVVPKDDEMVTVPRESIPRFYINTGGKRFCSSFARAFLDGIFWICSPQRVIFRHSSSCVHFPETAPFYKHNVKFPQLGNDKFMEVFRDHEEEDMFAVVFNLKH